VFAARTADASVELLENEPPRGIHHHYERLAIWDVDARTVTDCRHPWPPRGDGHDCSCGACVTPESHASGTFTIQDAVNQVQETGGTVCLSAGQYPLREPVRMANTRSVRVRGQGPATVIVSPGGAFALRNCVAVAIENLMILSLGRQPAISIASAMGLALQQLAIAVLGNRDIQGPAIALGGVVAGAMLRENAILAPFGIVASDPAVRDPDDREAPAFLVTAAVAVEDNFLWCARHAVRLTGPVGHLMGTRITGNQINGCSEAAVSMLGVGAPGSSMAISGNSMSVTGNGVSAGVDGLWIESNKVFNSAPETEGRRSTDAGIALVTGLDRSGADQCQLLANQISGFARAGILIGAPTRDLIVKMNIIENCGNGILSADDAKAGSISIENNHLRNIGSAEPAVVGIGVARAEAATVAGNTLRGIAVQTQQSTLSAAILTFGVLRARISGNEIADVAPPGDFGGVIAGIAVRAPYLEFDISNNQVQRDAAASMQSSNGAWFAVLVGEAEPPGPGGIRPGGFAAVRIDNLRMLVLGGRQPYIAVLADANSVAEPAEPRPAAAVAEPPARGSIIGNVLAARGAAPAVQVSAFGECLFNSNRVEARAVRVAAIVLNTTVAIVNANRVRGGEPSIQVLVARLAAVLGNVTTGSIAVPGGLPAPWDALNLRG
jgi:hypothetical protein